MTHMPIVINDQLGRGRSTLTSVGVNQDERRPHVCLRRGYLRSFLFFCNSGLCLCRQVLESANGNRQFLDTLMRNLVILPFGDNCIRSSIVCTVVKNVIPVLTVSQIWYVSFAKALCDNSVLTFLTQLRLYLQHVICAQRCKDAL
jgi:hypothetical protein